MANFLSLAFSKFRMFCSLYCNAIPEELRIAPESLGGNWTPLRSTGWTWIPPTMSPSPMELMDSWYAEYATKENLDSITNEIVTASISRYLERYKKRYGN